MPRSRNGIGDLATDKLAAELKAKYKSVNGWKFLYADDSSLVYHKGQTEYWVYTRGTVRNPSLIIDKVVNNQYVPQSELEALYTGKLTAKKFISLIQELLVKGKVK